MTTTPCIEIELISLRMASTAAPSPPSLSPRPTQRPAASAAASVTRTSSSARLRSSSSRLRGTSSVMAHPGTRLFSWASTWAGPAGGGFSAPADAGGLAGDGRMGYVSADAPAANPRSGRPARDMLLSMAVLLIPIFLLVGAYRDFYSGDAPVAVDASQTWATARHSAPYPVLAPDGLPKGWTVISATYAGGTLRVGYVSPSGGGLQPVESDRTGDVLLPAELGTDARPGNLVTIDGRAWRAYPVVHGGGRALVLVDQGRTVVVVGTVTDSDLHALPGR